MKKSILVLVAAVVAIMTAADAFADVKARLQVRTPDGRSRDIAGDVRWNPSRKQYMVTISAGGNAVTTPYAENQVLKLEVQPPANIGPAIKAAREGRLGACKGPLEQVIANYTMLQWDAKAGAELAECYLKNNNAAEALKVCERVSSVSARYRTSTEIAPVLWKSMLATGKTASLPAMLDAAMKDAPRQIAAQAAIIRGDMLSEEKRYKDALKDGYLRAVVLFRDQKEVMPEALYKAAQAFEAVQQISYAEKMRQMLLTNFANSEYAIKARGK